MKKTTLAIIGLSVCVVVLATALGVVLTQRKTETIILREPNPYTSSYTYIKPWQRFSLAPYPIKSFERKGLAVFHNGKVVTYIVIPGNKARVITPYK